MANAMMPIILRYTASQGEMEKLPDSEKTQILRDQETALVKLGELYRDQKCVSLNALQTECNVTFHESAEIHKDSQM